MHHFIPTFMHRAIKLSRTGMSDGDGGPFGCVIIRNNEIIAEGWNQVLSTNDPTAHAEVNAIRAACKKLGRFDLSDCEIYSSCEPCPMCLGAIYWARPRNVYYANTKQDAAAIEFDDSFIYDELEKPIESRVIPFHHYPDKDALAVFEQWQSKPDKIQY